MPAIFNVFSNFGTMCLPDNLVDSAICEGLMTVMDILEFSDINGQDPYYEILFI